MSLKQYIRKRDFSMTPEPSGAGRSSTSKTRTRSTKAVDSANGLSFVVQKHDATRLHYDFRLELNGVLKSWAVPKGPSLDPKDKRLAVEVEDHPLDYGGFEGVIPYGQYGGGTVMLWDRGTWSPLDADPEAALRKGRLKFVLQGERLRGQWTLTRMPNRGKHEKHNWLLIKHPDEDARSNGAALTEREVSSVATRRNLDAIAKAGGQARKRGNEASQKPPTRAKLANATIPRGIAPQLCTLADHTPGGPGWLHEIKFDGYRLIAELADKQVRLVTRAGKDWTAKFGPIADAIAALPCKQAVLDGEAVILDKNGRTHFQGLQQAIKQQRFSTLTFFVFDLLFLDGVDLRHQPLLERKRALQSLLGTPTKKSTLRYSDHVEGDGSDVQLNACRLGLEGIISKRADGPYTSGRTKTWLKIKCGRRQEFVVVGWTAPGGSRTNFGALLLAAHDADGKLVYTGKVGTGFDESTLRSLGRKLDALRVSTHPLDTPPPHEETRNARWVRPVLVAEIAFSEWPEDLRLRHPAFQGLRVDKASEDVRIERERPAEWLKAAAEKEVQAEVNKPLITKARPKSQSKSKTNSERKSAPPRRGPAFSNGSGSSIEIAGVTITHADRVIFPDCGVTKGDLARYYESVAELLLPFLVQRPLSVVRCMKGIAGACFFQKHLHETFADPVRSIRVKEKEDTGLYISVDSVEGLVTLVQMGVIEIHPWGSRSEDLEHPDQITIDLDPGPGVGFDRAKQGAQDVRAMLREKKMESFVKLSGGKGLHVVAPLSREMTWDEAKAFASDIAQRLATERPSLYVANMSKAKRHGKIFVDYLRNGRGATSVAPYTVRARPGAPIAMPITWEELPAMKAANQFTVSDVLDQPLSPRPAWPAFGQPTRPARKRRSTTRGEG
ncbi:MAG TPA: DNA ligase D [Phycisphaerales bacterium]